MSARTDPPAGELSFAPFRFVPSQRLLLDGDETVRLGSRACEILIALLERPGEVLGKDELIARVWPDTFVEEGNLKVHVAALRRALGDGQMGRRFIANVPGRGYSFVAPVETVLSEERHVEPLTPASLPALLGRMIGRADAIAAAESLLTNHRFLTITGPGGIGKTTVSVALAHRLLPRFPDGIVFVDLAPLSDPTLVPAALASALGVGIRTNGSASDLLAFVRDKRMLVILDSCEHVIDTAAVLAEGLFAGAGTGFHLLATSREPLRVEGEHVHRLASLACPPANTPLTASEALSYPAVQLFAERGSAGLDGFGLSDEDAPVVADLCRRLDGMALAIEIAAGQLESFGVHGLATRLDDQFRIRLRGRRTALPRHQTLSTTLDWSYALLAPFEQAVLRRLSIFAGSFTAADASQVAAGDSSTAAVIEALTNLVSKSLVSANVQGPIASYRLLDTTRAYAAAKLTESGDRVIFERRRADYMRRLLIDAGRAWAIQPAGEWLLDHRHLIDDVRAALDWCFSPSGDGRLGVDLSAGAVPLWFQSGSIGECGDRVRQALLVPPPADQARQEMQLYAALAWSSMQTRGWVQGTQEAWKRTLQLAEELEDRDYELRALWGLWAGLLNRSELRPALELARRFADLAGRFGQPADVFVGDRLIGYILHLLGRQTEARQHIERMVSGYTPPVTGAEAIRYVFDQRLTARCFLARILWVQGLPDQARHMVDAIVSDAQASGDMLTLCQTLVQAACPVALFNGDMDSAQHYVGMLVEFSGRDTLQFWQVWGRCFESVLRVRSGELGTGLPLLGTSLADLRAIQFGVYYIVFAADYASALAATGDVRRALQILEEAFARSEQNAELWYMPELLRVRGELQLASAEHDSGLLAEASFREAIDLARAQQTPAWELRAATSLGRLLLKGGRDHEVEPLLGPVYDRFTEGHDTADLRDAQAVLDSLRGS